MPWEKELRSNKHLMATSALLGPGLFFAFFFFFCLFCDGRSQLCDRRTQVCSGKRKKKSKCNSEKQLWRHGFLTQGGNPGAAC